MHFLHPGFYLTLLYFVVHAEKVLHAVWVEHAQRQVRFIVRPGGALLVGIGCALSDEL